MPKPTLLFWSLLAITILVDQASKWWHDRGGDIAYNTGVSLGLFSVLPPLVLTVILIGVLVVIAWLYRVEWANSPVASALFFGGGISNVIDRIIFGSVRDWLPVPYLSIYNNVADYAIGVGLLIMLINSLRKSYQSEVAELHAQTENEPEA